jgi:hypothetical protein
MTDDSNARYRSNEPRTPDQNGHGSDPLAELARLIRQGDFLSQSREVPPPPPRATQYYDEPAPHPTDTAQHFADAQPQAEPAYEPRIEPVYAPEQNAHPAPPSDWPAFDPFAPASSQRTPDLPPQRSSRSEFVFPQVHSQHAAHADVASYDEPPLGAPPRQDPAAMPFHLPSAHAASPPPLDEYHDDAPQGGRRKGLITVAAVFCLAVVGTAGAFGYRTWFGGPSVKSAPAVIKASTEPAKVAPPALSSDPNSNKISYDRFGDRGQNEKVVLREEKPVDIKEATRSGAGMSSVPMPSQPAAATPPAAASANNPPSVLTDPKKVRTVTIRPDAPDASTTRQPMVTPPQPAAQAPAPTPARQTAVAAAPSNAPLDLGNPSAPPPPQARAAAPRPSTPPPAVRPAQAAPSANAPLSLAPENGSAPAAAPRPARLAAAPASGGGNGNYLVQVSSQRSEADAQAALRSVQSRYSSVLGDRQVVIRRAELAGKGTYYRAMVGPFSSRDQAVQLCSSLKAAGGDCVVQSN